MTNHSSPQISIEAHPTPHLWQLAQRELARDEYRPTVIAACFRAGGDLPGVQVATVIPESGTQWGLPQGGIEPQDGSLSLAARRELAEELGFDKFDVMYAQPTGTAIRARRDESRRGFKNGALYTPVAVIATYDAGIDAAASNGELRAAGWQSLPAFAEDIVEQHCAEASSRTHRTIAALGQAIDVVGVVMEHNPPAPTVHEDLRLAAELLKPAHVSFWPAP